MLKKTAPLAITSAVIALMTMGYLAGQEPARKPAAGKAGEENADTADIKKAGQAFLKAYMDGDAKALAASWTENGEYFSDDGTLIRGRAEIEKSYAELFAKKNGKTEAEIEVGSIRFPSKDTAIEEGYFKARVRQRSARSPPNSPFCTFARVASGSWLWCASGPVKGSPSAISIG